MVPVVFFSPPKKRIGSKQMDQMIEKISVVSSTGITFFAKNFHWDKPFHLNSHRNYRVFRTNDKRAYSYCGASEMVNESISPEAESVESVTVQWIWTQRNRSLKKSTSSLRGCQKGKKGTAHHATNFIRFTQAILIAPKSAASCRPCKPALTLCDEADRPIGREFLEKQTNNLQQPTKNLKKTQRF